MTEQSTAATQTTDAAVDTATSATTAAVTDAATTTATADATTQAATTDTASTESGTTDAKTDDKPASTAPEKYEFTPPEGTQVDAAYQERFEGIARKLNLTQEQANELYALGGELAQNQQKAFETALATQSEQWAEASRTDKEIGGEKFDANIALAKKTMATYATPEFRQLIEQTRLGNHPELIRMLSRIGSTIADDTIVNAPSAGGSERRSVASKLFDHSSSQKR